MIVKYVQKLEELEKALEKVPELDHLLTNKDSNLGALLDQLAVLRQGPRETVLAMAQVFEDVVRGPDDISTYSNPLTNVKVRGEKDKDGNVAITVFLPECFKYKYEG